jgi:hypothetical protein
VCDDEIPKSKFSSLGKRDPIMGICIHQLQNEGQLWSNR